MLDIFKSDVGIIVLICINAVLFLSAIITTARVNRMNRITKQFMRKLGDGKDIRQDLNMYIDRIIDLEAGLSETNSYCKQLDNRLKCCLQKVGVVKYNAYKDAGNDLSFAVALLDENDNGIVFNGIYSREMSNIYCKPILSGVCKYNLTEEEKEALKNAMRKLK